MNYFEEYFDLIDALPKEAQRALSSLREADSQCAKNTRRLKEKIQHFLELEEDPQGAEKKEKDLASIRTYLSKGLTQSETRRQAAIRLDLTVEKILKKATSRLEKIEEHFVDKIQEEQEEKEFVEQQQQQQAQNSLQQKNKKQTLQAKGKIAPASGFAPGHVASASNSPAGAGAVPSSSSSALLPSPSSTLSSSAASANPNPTTPGSLGAQGATSLTNAASGGQAGPGQASANGANPSAAKAGPTATTPEGQALGKKRKEQASASTAANAAKKPKTTSQPYPREDLLMNLPIYSGRGPCPPLCGPNPAAADYILKKGDAVAARTTKPKDPNPEWILATVVRYYAGRNRYEVEDVEEEEVSDGKGGYIARKKYVLSADAIIPLPKTLPDPTKKLEFPANKKVLALYPGTTCFYEAVVIAPPSKRRKEIDYLVQFEDDEESDSPLKAIPQMFVLNMPQITSSE